MKQQDDEDNTMFAIVAWIMISFLVIAGFYAVVGLQGAILGGLIWLFGFGTIFWFVFGHSKGKRTDNADYQNRGAK